MGCWGCWIETHSEHRTETNGGPFPSRFLCVCCFHVNLGKCQRKSIDVLLTSHKTSSKLYVLLFLCSCVRSFVCLFVCLFARLFVRAFVRSCVRSLFVVCFVVCLFVCFCCLFAGFFVSVFLGVLNGQCLVSSIGGQHVSAQTPPFPAGHGSKSRLSPSEHPNPTTKIGPGEFTYQPKWHPKTVLTTTAIYTFNHEQSL